MLVGPSTTPNTITPPSRRIAVIQPSEKAIAFLTPPFEARRTITPTSVHGVSALRIVIGRRSTSSLPTGDRYPCSAGPAQTTSSAGHPAQAHSLGRGGNRPSWIRAIAAESSASSSGSCSRRNTASTSASGRSRNW